MATAKKKAGTGVTVWQQQLAEAAKQQVATEALGGDFKSISTRSGVLSVDDTPLKDNELRCVVLVTAHENKYYEGKYNPDVKSIPNCFAFSAPDGDDEDMAPHEDAMEKQNDTCAGCWANEMGSADTGRGKACKNVRRLALVTEDAVESGEALDEAEVRSLQVAVTSVKNWSKFVHRVADEMQRPAWGVVCLIKLVPDVKTQFKLQFTFESLIDFDQDLMDAMQSKREEISKTITLPYQQPTEEAAPPVNRKKPQGKAVSKKPALRQSPVTQKRKVGKY